MIPDDPNHTFTHAVSTGAVTSPLWLHSLSDTAQTALPVLGAIWLILQGAVFIYKNFYIVKNFFRKPKA